MGHYNKLAKIYKGYTLIELAITVFIIAILTLIALPVYQDYSIRSQVSESLSITSGIKQAIAEFYSNSGKYPTNQSLDFKGDTGKYISKTEIGTEGSIVATFGKLANAKINNKFFALTPSPDKDTSNFKWFCESNLDPKYIPIACQARNNPPVDPENPSGEPVTTIESQNLTCPPGYSGQITQERIVITYPNGSIDYNSWITISDSCLAIAPTIKIEQHSLACSPGYSGEINQERTITTYYDGSVDIGEWTTTSNTCIAIAPVVTIENQNLNCQPGYTGQINQQRTVTTYYDGRIEYGSWNTTSSNCSPIPPVVTTESRNLSCTAPQTGAITESRTVTTYYNGTVNYGSWNVVANSCSYPSTIPYTAIIACTPNQPIGSCVALNQRPGYNLVIIGPQNVMVCQAPYSKMVGNRPNVSCGL